MVIRLSLLALILGLFLPLMAAPLVTNGTFDTDCSGWTTSNVDGSFCQNGSGGLGAGNPGGFAVLNNGPGVSPTMSQSLAGLNIGDLYQLTWDMESAYHCCGSSTTPGASASIDGNTWQFIIPNSQGWTGYGQTFVYTGTDSTLSFASQINGTDTDAGFDNIVLTDLGPVRGEVPEPATFVLLGAGLVAVYLRRRS